MLHKRRSHRQGAAIAALLAAVLAATGAQHTYAAKTVTLTARKDAFVSSDRPDDNFGPSSSLLVGQRSTYGATRTVVYFELDDLAREEVPVEGKLRMYLRDAGGVNDPSRDIVLYRLTDDWDERTVTWNRFPGYKDERRGSTGVGTSRGWYGWDVGQLVRNWYQLKWKNRGIYVQGYEAEGSYRSFDSREAANSPELELTIEIDRTPPTAMLDPLPPYSLVSQITLTWPEAVDPYPSSLVDYYEVWMQRNDEPWARLADGLRQLTYTVGGLQNGCIYKFRVQAVDRAGNRQPDGPAQTQTLADFSPPIAHINALPQWVNGPFDILWTGADEPTGAGVYNSGIEKYTLEWNINATTWGPLSEGASTAYRFEPEHDVYYQFRVTPKDRAGNVGAPSEPVADTRSDLVAPVVTFAPTSGIDSPTFRVHWSGDDGGASGVVSYDIQYRAGETGSWINWASNTQESFRDFDGEYGWWYFFRGRAQDLAGNEGEFPANAQLAVSVRRSSDLTHVVCLPAVANR
jgi:hypothetical protein